MALFGQCYLTLVYMAYEFLIYYILQTFLEVLLSSPFYGATFWSLRRRLPRARFALSCVLSPIIIQQIVTMPIYGKEALNICHLYMTDILRYT